MSVTENIYISEAQYPKPHKYANISVQSYSKIFNLHVSVFCLDMYLPGRGQLIPRMQWGPNFCNESEGKYIG